MTRSACAEAESRLGWPVVAGSFLALFAGFGVAVNVIATACILALKDLPAAG